MDKISIIVPCYNEEKALPEFYRVASESVSNIDGAECEFLATIPLIFLKASAARTAGADTFPFHGTSEKKPPCMPAFRMLPATTASSWTQICSIRPDS